MLSRTKSLLSVGALLLGAAACRSGSTPSSNTAASTNPSATAPSTPESQAAASATNTPTTDPGLAGTTAVPPTDPSRRDTPADPALAGTQAAAAESDPAAAAATSTPLSDAQIAAITDGVNSAEIEQAKLAKATTKNPEVRRFATMMIEHHGEAKKKQASLKLETADSPLSQQMSEEASTTLATLKSKKGAEFDRAYLEAQVEGHQKVLDALDHDLRPQAQNPELQNYLAELEPKVSQHLQSAHSAQQALESAPSKGKKTSSP